MKHPCRAGPCVRRLLRLPHSPGLVLAFFLCAAAAFGQAGNSAESPAAGQTVRRITPDEAVELAVQNNLSLESSRVALDTKKRQFSLVWNQFLPEFDVRGTLSRSNEEASPLQPELWSFNGNLSASLNFSFALIEGINSVKVNYQSGLLSFAKARAQMERDIRKSYYQMLLLQENIALLQGSFANAERQVTMAQANYRNGLVPQLTLLQAQVSRDNLKPSIDQMENGLKVAMANFAMSLGLDYDTQFELVPVTGDLNYISLDVKDLITKSANGKPDILELRQSVLAMQSLRKVQALQLYTPYINFAWNYSPTLLGPWDNSWGDGDNWMDRGAFSITLGMSLNSLFPFTKQGQGLKDTDNNLRAQNILLAQAIRGTEIEIYNTVFSLERAQISAETQAQTVALAERSYQLTEEAYRAGLQELLQVQNADLARRQARVQMLEQQFNYRTGLIDLEYSIGVPFGTLSNGGNTK
ncbi:TolC family protein [Treponema primitia]|uniref:TolC family protein n=1 Tax=Treponema primitia TaxID=88058 RepID=UPI00025555C9|nr:TolC family protein [Treponema primitia]